MGLRLEARWPLEDLELEALAFAGALMVSGERPGAEQGLVPMVEVLYPHARVRGWLLLPQLARNPMTKLKMKL